MFCTIQFSCFPLPDSFFDCVRSHLHVFWRYRGRRVPFSCIALTDSFSAVPRVSGLVFMFYTPRLIFSGTESVGSHFHFFRSRTRFRRYGGPGVPFLCFARPDSFSEVPRASGLVFMFCDLGHVFGGTEGVRSRFHILRFRTRFRRYRGRRFPFSCFARPDSFSAVPRASGPVFMFCAPKVIFDGSEGVGFCFHVLRSRICFRRCRARRVMFSCYARPDSFSAVSRASDLVFMFSAPGYVFGGAEGVESCFHVLRSWTRFRRYRGRRVLFSCFARRDSFFAEPRASAPFFMYFRFRTRFRRYGGCQVPFSCSTA
jgi:hypothetical protein